MISRKSQKVKLALERKPSYNKIKRLHVYGIHCKRERDIDEDAA